jgi:hypothetical protein
VQTGPAAEHDDFSIGVRLLEMATSGNRFGSSAANQICAAPPANTEGSRNHDGTISLHGCL